MPNNDLLKYAGLATQIIISLGISVCLGYKADHAMAWKFPLLTLLMPVLVLVSLFWRILNDTKPRS